MAWAYTLSLAGVVFAPIGSVASPVVHSACSPRRNLGSPISCGLVVVWPPRRASRRTLTWWGVGSTLDQAACGGAGGNRTRVRDASASLRTTIEGRPPAGVGRGWGDPCSALVRLRARYCEGAPLWWHAPYRRGHARRRPYALGSPGWGRWDRTIDRRLIGPVLCRLSYPPVGRPVRRTPRGAAHCTRPSWSVGTLARRRPLDPHSSALL